MGPVVLYQGTAQSVEMTSGGKRLRVFVAREGRSNDVLLFPSSAKVDAGDAIATAVRPSVERDSGGRLLDSIVYWVDGDE